MTNRPRPQCAMPDCSIEIKPGDKYCAACEWLKEITIKEMQKEMRHG